MKLHEKAIRNTLISLTALILWEINRPYVFVWAPVIDHNGKRVQ